MKLRRALALLLAPDLHDIARRLGQTEMAVGTIRGHLESLRDHPVSLSIQTALLDEAVDDLVETQAILIEVLADLTGRRPDVLLKGG